MKQAILDKINGNVKPTSRQKEAARRKKIHKEELEIARAAQRSLDAQQSQSRVSTSVIAAVGAPGTRFPLDSKATAHLTPGQVADAEMSAGMAMHNGVELPGYVHPLLGEEFEWTPVSRKAARCAAEGMPPMMIEDRLDLHPGIFEQWMRNVDFKLAVRQYVETLTEDVMTSGLANRAHRLVAQNLRWQAQKDIIHERAEAAKLNPEAPPGASTGWLDNKNEYDAAMAREMRETEKHGAIEVGQWSEGPPPVTRIEIEYVDKQLIVQHE